jgi:hypothetical protein
MEKRSAYDTSAFKGKAIHVHAMKVLLHSLLPSELEAGQLLYHCGNSH